MVRCDALLDSGIRTSKPRDNGITIMIDKGQMGRNAIADFVSVAGAHCDYAKIAWGSALITGNLEEKLACYRAAQIVPVLGGTLFEYAFLRGKAEALLELAGELRVHVEISDGVIDLPRRDKLHWIERFARQGEVFSEVGGKLARHKLDWNQAIREELAAGAHKVVIEGREIGPIGMIGEAEVRTDLVDTVLAAADASKLVFEAFERRQQTWLIKRLGPNVNLGNIPPTDLLTVESFRRGLKEHTLLHTFNALQAKRAASQ